MNYAHLEQNKTVEPGFSDFRIGVLSEFLSIKKPEAPFTNPGDEVKITDSHTFETDKGFYRIYQVKKRHGGKGDPTGTFGAKTLLNEIDVFIPGINAVQMEWVKNIINEEILTLHRDSDCAQDQWIQLGDACRPAEIDINYTTGTYEPTGEKGFFGKIKWTGIPKFYEGTITMAPEAESTS
jgi:hypothetical protein